MKQSSDKIKVLMIGTDKSTGGGMWTVANNYLNSEFYNHAVALKYIPTFVVGSSYRRALFALWAYIRIFFQLVFNRPQILHVHMSEKGSVYRKGIAMNMASHFKCKILIHMHGAEFQIWYNQLSQEKKRRVKSILNLAEKVIILGEYWKKFISSLVPEERIEVVYNAVPHQEKIYNPDGKTILFLGAVGKRKGAYDLVTALSAVKEKIPENLKLCFYGPDFENKIEEEIKKNNGSDRIKYCGWLDSAHKEQVYADTICNVLPSYNEGLPMTILETMAVGIPSITTNIAAIPEVVNQENGYIIEPGNIEMLKQALVEICNDRSLRITKSNNAYKDIEQGFTIDNNVKSVLALYKVMVKNIGGIMI